MILVLITEKSLTQQISEVEYHLLDTLKTIICESGLLDCQLG